MIADLMRTIGLEARTAAPVLELSSGEVKNRALRAAAASLRAHRHKILAANERDVRAAEGNAVTGAMLERLKLDERRVEAMARALEDVERLPDPIGTVLAEWTRPNGMVIQRRRVPLGVIGIIYESRPNVTADAGALCLKSGNAVILRGGSESAHSNAAIHACLDEGLKVAGLPSGCIQLVPTTDRAAVGYMLAEMTKDIDVIVPRGGKNLIARVQAGGACPGDRTSRGCVPRLCRPRRKPDDGARHRLECQNAAYRASAAQQKPCWWTAGVPRRISPR